MKYALSLLIALAAIGAAQAAGTDWVLVTTPAPGAPKVFYSPTTVKLENDRGTPVRATKVKIVAADGRETRETWKVVMSQCKPLPRTYLDVSIYTNGKLAGVQRSLSLTNTKLDSTKMARVACGLALNP